MSPKLSQSRENKISGKASNFQFADVWHFFVTSGNEWQKKLFLCTASDYLHCQKKLTYGRGGIAKLQGMGAGIEAYSHYFQGR